MRKEPYIYELSMTTVYSVIFADLSIQQLACLQHLRVRYAITCCKQMHLFPQTLYYILQVECFDAF